MSEFIKVDGSFTTLYVSVCVKLECLTVSSELNVWGFQISGEASLEVNDY